MHFLQGHLIILVMVALTDQRYFQYNKGRNSEWSPKSGDREVKPQFNF